MNNDINQNKYLLPHILQFDNNIVKTFLQKPHCQISLADKKMPLNTLILVCITLNEHSLLNLSTQNKFIKS